VSRRKRVFVGLPAALAAFAALGGCGQRGPLTLPESARPIQRLDNGAAQVPGTASPATAAPSPGAPGAESTQPDGAPRPEDDERTKK
jgi:predicted small lipoprotein YifL